MVSIILLCAGCSTTRSSSAVSTTQSSVTVRAFAKSALLGMQLSVKRSHQAGKVTNAGASCVASLTPDSFADVYEGLLKSTFTAGEMKTTEEFFQRPIGHKYATHGLLKVYESSGHQAPEPLPSFSSAETKELVTFSKTAAGEKLIAKKVLSSAAASRALNARVAELLARCDVASL